MADREELLAWGRAKSADREELLRLAERCEAASGPDRELDVAIGLTDKFYVAEPRYPGAEPMIGYIDTDGCRVEPGNGAQDCLVPRYTASLDATMTLVPEGWGGSIHFSENRLHSTVKLGRSYPTNANTFGESATPALALAAASLRARAQEPLRAHGGDSDMLAALSAIGRDK